MKGAFMEIKVIGVDSKNGIKLMKNIEKVEKEMKLKFNVSKVSSKNRDKYGIREVPALIIDDDIISKGSVLTEREIKNIIKEKIEVCIN